MDEYGAMQYDPTGEALRNTTNLNSANDAFRGQMAKLRTLRDMQALGPSTAVNADASGDALPQGAPVNVRAAPAAPAAPAVASTGTITAPKSLAQDPSSTPDQTNAELNRLSRAGTVAPFNNSPGLLNRGVNAAIDAVGLGQNSPAAQNARLRELQQKNPASAGVENETLSPGKNDAAIARLKSQNAAIMGGTASPGGSVASRNNNPGNLVYVGQAGATPSPTVNADGTRFAVFQTPEAGAAAAQAQLQKEIASGNNTVAGIIHKWAGAQYQGNSPASEQNYVASIAKALGVNPNSPLTVDKIPLMSQAMFKVEGGSAPAQTAQAQPASPAGPQGPQGPGQQYHPGGNNFDYTGHGAEQALQVLARQQQMAEIRARNATTPQEAMQARSEADQASTQANILHGQILSAHAYKAQQDVAAGNMDSFGSLVQLASQMRGTPLAIHQTGQGQYGLFDAQGKPYGPTGAPVDIARFIYAQTPSGQQLAASNAQKFNEAYQTASGKATGETGKELALESLKGQNEVQKALTSGNMTILLEKVKQGEFMASPNGMGGVTIMSKDGKNLGIIPADAYMAAAKGAMAPGMTSPIAPWMMAQK